MKKIIKFFKWWSQHGLEAGQYLTPTGMIPWNFTEKK